MKIWVDDIRPAPEGYVWCKSTNDTIRLIQLSNSRIEELMERGHNAFLARDVKARTACYQHAKKWDIELIDLDHDSGDFAYDGGDYIKVLDYIEANRLSYPIKLHSMNPVGLSNMRLIIEKNNWTEIK